jgi:N-acetylmuramoyl-L-alanine amidase
MFAAIATLVVGVGIAMFSLLRPPARVTNAAVVEPTARPTLEFSASVEPTKFAFTPQTPNPPEGPTSVPNAEAQPDVAIVAGHWSPADPEGVSTIHDPGSVCQDGLREVDINKSVADKVQAALERRGYRVALLGEFDSRLKRDAPDFGPKVFLSIHTDACVGGPDFPFATGYKIAHAVPSVNPTEDDRLVNCLKREYGRAVAPYKLNFNGNSITDDMTEYHAFREIVTSTPAAIIELGFMFKDRVVLTKHQDDMARGLTIGLNAFLHGDTCTPPTETPTAGG